MASALQQKLGELRKKDKDLRIGSISDLQTFTGNVYSTGNVAMDNALSVGGFPSGKVIELYGRSMSGKTTSAIQAIAVHQDRVRCGQAEGAVLYLDYEHSLDQGYCQALGIDVSDTETFVYVQPDTFEQGAQLFRDLAGDGLLAFGVVDSVAAMVPRKEIEAESGAHTFADRARMLHQFFRQSKGMMAKTGTSVILLNHVMDKIDTSPMGQRMAAQGIKRETTPGGTAIEFYADMRIQFTQVKSHKTVETDPVSHQDDKLVTSTDVDAKVLKNKLGIPQKIAHMRIRYGRGFSQPYSVFTVLLGYGKIKKDGSWFKLSADVSPTREPMKIQGEEALLSRLESDPDWLRRMEVLARKLVGSDPNEEIEDNIDPLTGEVREEAP